MKPPKFRYFAPQSVEEALTLLVEHADEAQVLAGGQSLVPLMNMRLAHPGVLVDINGISELAYVRPWDGGLALGAMTRDATLERDTTAAARLPLLERRSRKGKDEVDRESQTWLAQEKRTRKAGRR